MGKILAFALGSTALFSVAVTGPAQAADFEPVTVYPYAATGFFAGGYAWMDREECLNQPGAAPCSIDDGPLVESVEWLILNGGGDIVLPLDNNLNLQLGAAVRVDNLDFINQFTRAGPSDSVIQFQGSVIGFWRDPSLGVFGIEAGAFSPLGKKSTDGGPPDGSRFGQYTSLKIGGVAEYFFSDMITIGGYGGALLPFWRDPFTNKPSGKSMDTGYYAGGHLTFYASDMLGVAGYGQYTELNAHADNGFEQQRTALKAGGRIRYLTSMPNVEMFASAGYIACEETFGGPQSLHGRYTQEGAEFMAGVNIRLGGISDSLVSIDRSNAIDTRTWSCANIRQ